jgi:alpha-glucosidase (family GH31 glycosyl hydrolase)
VERGLPISMIVIDWFHWKEMGDWELNPECWPEPQAMVDELVRTSKSGIPPKNRLCG